MKKQKTKIKDFLIEEGLFFKEDFKKLPDSAIIFIKKGMVLVNQGSRTNDTFCNRNNNSKKSYEKR
jgi:hypothetical protein